MKRRYIVLWIFVYALLSPFISLSQYQHIQFDQLTSDDGLPSNTINCIHQDSKGFMWFGTYNGLTRYNGYEYDVFRVENDNPYSISGNRITAIHEDQSGLLWIGTWRAGINIFDPKTERFTYFQDAENELSSKNVRSVTEDKNKNIWIGTVDGGLNKFNRKDSTFNHFLINTTIDNQSHDNIISMQIDESQKIWMGCENTGIAIFNTKTETFNTIDSLDGQSIYTNESKKLYFDSKGTLWMLTNGQGVFAYDTANQKLTHYKNDPVSKQSFSNFHFTNITEDHQGNLWLTTDGQGLVIYKPQNNQFTIIKNTTNTIGLLNSNSLYSLFEDNTNIMWLGTFSGGINIYDPNKMKFEQYHNEISLQIATKGESVLSLFEDSKKNIWAGTDGDGLYKLDNKTKIISHYINNPDNPYSISTNVIKSIYEDDKGMIWLGTWEFGIDIFDPITERKIDNINNENSPIKMNNIWIMYEDSYQDLWISTLGNGLSKINQKDNQHDYYTPTMLHHNNVMTILEDDNKTIWIGTEGTGFNIYDRENNQFKHHYILSEKCPEAPCNDIRTIYQDRSGKMLLGTEGAGILVMHSPIDSFQVINTDNGLASNIIHGVLEDKVGNYWVSTIKGISKYNPKTKKSKNYNKADGLQGDEFNYSSSLLTSSGKIVFGGINGLNIFDPLLIQENLNPPIVTITKFYLFNQLIKPLDETGLLNSNINETDEIILKYDQSVISFTFSALNYTLTEKNQYAYMMEGFDKDWVYVGTKRTATYTSLDPGTYTFKVKASNNDGVWNEEGTSIILTILPPFWETWWFRTFILLLFSSTLFYIIKTRINRFKIESEKLEILVNEKTKELIEQRDNMKVLAKQIEEANINKINFFTNISHELRTPLTLITSPLDKILSSISTSSNVIKELQIVKRNSNRLLRLVNQIMDFSKAETETMPINIIKGDIIHFITDIKEVFTELANLQNKNYQLNTDITEKIAWFDADKVEKITYNLLSNAFKFTDENGHVNIDISIYISPNLIPKDSELFRSPLKIVGEFIEIRVSNTGEGIAENKIPKMFERFHQLENANKSTQQGTGIGLALTKKLVELQQGEIFVNSKEGEITIFTVRLPISKEFWENNDLEEYLNYELKPIQKLTNTDVELVERTDTPIEQFKIEQPSKTILIVEDNPEVQDLIVDLFKSKYTILTAYDGVEGCNIALNNHPDLIISDVNMPNKSGVELCNELKTDITTSHIPILLLTAKSSKESRIEGLETGADDYITKPFDNDLLMVRVENLLISREKLREKFSTNAFSTVADITITSTDNTFMQKASSFVEENINDINLDGDMLVNELGLSRSALYRKLKNVTGQSVNEFIRTIRLKSAAQYLSKSDLRISEICYEIGFSDPHYFSKCFKKQFGKTPSEFKESNKKAV